MRIYFTKKELLVSLKKRDPKFLNKEKRKKNSLKNKNNINNLLEMKLQRKLLKSLMINKFSKVNKVVKFWQITNSVIIKRIQ